MYIYKYVYVKYNICICKIKQTYIYIYIQSYIYIYALYKIIHNNVVCKNRLHSLILRKKTHINPSPICRFFRRKTLFPAVPWRPDHCQGRPGMIAKKAICDGSIRFSLGRLVVHLVVYPMNDQLRLFDLQIFNLGWFDRSFHPGFLYIAGGAGYYHWLLTGAQWVFRHFYLRDHGSSC